MQARKQALLNWLTVVVGKKINNINDLKSCLIIEELLAQIQGFVLPSINGEFQGWKLNYKKMKSIYDHLEQYFRQNLKCAFPSNLSIMNMVEMSKGESEQGLQSLLLMVFIVCIRCPSKEKFIPCIMQLSADAQEELMQIIQQSSVMKDEREDYDNQINIYKQQIARIEYLYRNLSAEYGGLRQALDEDAERIRRNDQTMKILVKQNENLVKSLAVKSELLRQKAQKQIEHYTNSNDDLVDELKKTIIQQQDQYGQQILRLKQVIQNISQQLTEVKRTNHELLEEQSRNSFVRNSDEHINCISIEKYKLKVSELTVNCKQSTQREMAAKLENVKLKNLISELQMKNKRMMEEKLKRQNQFLINSADGNKLKIEVLSRLRDSLKKTVTEQKIKNNKLNSNEKIDFFDEES